MVRTLKSAQICQLRSSYCMLVRIAFRFLYGFFMVMLSAMGTEGRVLPFCSRAALILSLDASIKSRQLVLPYGIFSFSKSYSDVIPEA